MRKIYLFITAALLLIGSGTMWAENTGTASLDDGEAQPINDAISAWKTNGGTLTLLEDCNYETPSATSLSSSYGSRKEWTLNLNDQHLTWNVTGGGTLTVNALTVGLYGSLTINGGDANNGKITFIGSNTEKKFNGLNPFSVSTAYTKINGGTFEAKNSATTGSVNVLLIGNKTSYNNANSGISDEAKFENHVTSTAGKVIKSGSYKVQDAAYVAEGYIYVKDGDYYKLVQSESSYVASVNGNGYTKDNVSDIWTDFAGSENISVEILKSSADERFTILATFDGTVTIAEGNSLYIENAGKMVFAAFFSTTKTVAGPNLINNGTVTFDGASNRTFNNPVIINNGTMNIASKNTFAKAIELSGSGKFYLAENCKFPELAYNQLKDLDVEFPDATSKWCKNGTDYQVCLDKDIVATTGSGDDIVYYSNLNTALTSSSLDNPAVLYSGHEGDITLSATLNSPKDVALDMNGKNVKYVITYVLKQTKGLLKIMNSSTTGGVIISDIASGKCAIEIFGRDENDGETGLYIGENVTIKNEKVGGGYAVGIFNKTSGQKKCYGVNIDIEGTILSNNGISINGTVTEGTPVINIGDNAVITGGCGDNASIYAAGYGIWNIGAATLKAGTPIYAKSGVINIDGASVEACGAFAEPTPHGSGYYGTGDAIVLDSKSGYAGNMQLNVTDATISSANGYSVQEVLTDSPESSTIAMQITGGKYKGARGTIVTSKHFGESTPTHWAYNSIVGGKYAYAPTTVADGYKVAFNTDADKNEFPYIIAVDDLYPTGTITEITENTSVDDVVTVADNDGLVIKSGVTYTVKGLVIGTGVNSTSKVTVEAGAKLIVGEYGIVNYANNQLVLQADKDNGCAILRFDETTSNLNPYGKVELYMYAHKEDGVNVWQHIGIPTVGAPDAIEKSAPYMFNVWDLKTGWKYAAQEYVNSPWTGYNSSTNMEAPGSKLTFTGRLVGGSDADFVLAPNNYSCIANSYTDYVSIAGFINQLPEGETDGTVWVYGMEDSGKVGFTLYNSGSFILKPDPGFSPMQAFFIKNVTANEIQLNVPYGGMGTVRDAIVTEINGGIIKLSDGIETASLQIIEKDDLSDDMDPNYDAEQFATDMIQIYVKQGTKNLAAIGTNSLDGKEIEIVTKSATQYTLSFEHLAGKAFKLTDLASGAEVEVGSDKTYTFTAAANSTIKRFILGEGEVSAEEANADAVKIWSANGSLFVEGNAAEADIEIINLSGVKVANAKASGEAVQAVSISNLASGVYVVRVGNTAAKIVK